MTQHELILQPTTGTPAVLRVEPDWRPQISLKRSIRGPARGGLLLVVTFVIVLTVWGFGVPLAGGAMAPGLINPNQGKKTVQHLEDGIIAELRVHDGDVVKKGQPLLVLEDVQARAAHDALQQQQWSLLAKQARLTAEGEGLSQIVWPPELQSPDPKIHAVIDAQQKVFETRRKELATKKGVLRQRIAQLSDQIKGIDMQVQSASTQLGLIDEELKGKKQLMLKGLLPKPEYLLLKRTKAEIEGRRGEYLAAIARSNQQIGETQIQIEAADAERATQIANDSDEVRQNLGNITEKLRSNEDILRRTVITAPISGTVINFKFKTVGGVVERGQPILQIVPTHDSLVIEARVTPLDVKAVHKGLRAEIRFPAYSSRSTPRVPGLVESVSPDRLLDEYTHQPYYLARVDVNRDVLKRIAPNVKLIPGMPADVLIITGHHTMFHYLFQPFLDVFRNSFHET
jgi:HlyD family secretion protein